jgi:hypothetical protein
LVVLGALGITGCGEETPERAVYAFAHDAEHDLRDAICDRMLASTALPSETAEALGLPSSTGRRQVVWNRRVCEQRIEEGILDSVITEPRVQGVRDVDVEPQGGITDAAMAVLTGDGSTPTSIPVVRYEARWRVVLRPADRR